jgi:regulatory protein YycI of two-component signal transduction system YycFG
MKTLKKYKTIMLIIIIIIIAFIAYTFLFGGKKDKSLLVSDSVTENSNNADTAVESDLLTLLLDIRSIKLNQDVFSNNAFKSLEDFGQDIAPEPVGRNNPFAPIDFIVKQNTDIIDQVE